MPSFNQTLKNREKALPPGFSFVYSFDWHRRFTLKERLQILFGYRLVVRTRWFTAHSAGAVQPIFAGELTKHMTPLDQVVADSKTESTRNPLSPTK